MVTGITNFQYNQSRENKMNNNKKSLINIDAVEPMGRLPSSILRNWHPVFKSFDPLGTIEGMLVRTLAYKIESKRLNQEIERINHRASVAHHLIDASLKVQLQKLEQHRQEFDCYYQAHYAEMKDYHLDRKKFMKMAEQAQKSALHPELSVEERQQYLDMFKVLLEALRDTGNQAQISLQNLANAMIPMELSANLLES